MWVLLQLRGSAQGAAAGSYVHSARPKGVAPSLLRSRALRHLLLLLLAASITANMTTLTTLSASHALLSSRSAQSAPRSLRSHTKSTLCVQSSRGSACAPNTRILGCENTCLLVATTTSQRSRHLHALTGTLAALLTRHSWVRAALNLYDGDLETVRRLRYRVHPRIKISTVPGFKPLFWKRVLTPYVLKQYSHLFLFDDDMRIHPDEFQLLTLLRLYEQTNVSILSPAPYGPGRGLYPFAGGRCGRTRPCLDSCNFNRDNFRLERMDENCAVCLQPVVEVKAPMFSSAAWAIVHRQMLAKLPDVALAGDAVDMYWCGLLERFHRGVTDHVQRVIKFNASRLGQACAYSYVTPMRHDDHKSLEVTDLAQSGGSSQSQGQNASRYSPRKATAEIDKLFRQERGNGSLTAIYNWAMPSWRPKQTQLFSEENGPVGCWTMDRVASSMSNWSAYEQAIARQVATSALAASALAASASMVKGHAVRKSGMSGRRHELVWMAPSSESSARTRAARIPKGPRERGK